MKDLLKKNWLLLVVVAYAAFMTFTSVDNKDLAEHYKLEAERDKAIYKHREDSIRGVLNKEQEERLKLMRQSAEDKMIIQEEKTRADKYQKQYENIRVIRHTSDHQRDSTLSAILSN